jgi:hypothetical protein
VLALPLTQKETSWLTTITDVVGMASSFGHGDGDFIQPLRSHRCRSPAS